MNGRTKRKQERMTTAGDDGEGWRLGSSTVGSGYVVLRKRKEEEEEEARIAMSEGGAKAPRATPDAADP